MVATTETVDLVLEEKVWVEVVNKEVVERGEVMQVEKMGEATEAEVLVLEAVGAVVLERMEETMVVGTEVAGLVPEERARVAVEELEVAGVEI